MFVLQQPPADLVAWCKHIFEGDEYAFLDTETTSFLGQVIDLALVGTRGNVLYSGLLRPTCSISPKSQKVHGISWEMVQHAPTFRDEWPAIREAFGDRAIIGWNMEFDGERVEQTAGVWRVQLPQIQSYCLMKGYTQFKWLARHAKLEVACRREGLDLGEQEHRALSDTMAVYELARKLAGPKNEYSRYLDWREMMEGA